MDVVDIVDSLYMPRQAQEYKEWICRLFYGEDLEVQEAMITRVRSFIDDWQITGRFKFLAPTGTTRVALGEIYMEFLMPYVLTSRPTIFPRQRRAGARAAMMRQAPLHLTHGLVMPTYRKVLLKFKEHPKEATLHNALANADGGDEANANDNAADADAMDGQRDAEAKGTTNFAAENARFRKEAWGFFDSRPLPELIILMVFINVTALTLSEWIGQSSDLDETGRWVSFDRMRKDVECVVGEQEVACARACKGA